MGTSPVVGMLLVANLRFAKGIDGALASEICGGAATEQVQIAEIFFGDDTLVDEGGEVLVKLRRGGGGKVKWAIRVVSLKPLLEGDALFAAIVDELSQGLSARDANLSFFENGDVFFRKQLQQAALLGGFKVRSSNRIGWEVGAVGGWSKFRVGCDGLLYLLNARIEVFQLLLSREAILINVVQHLPCVRCGAFAQFVALMAVVEELDGLLEADGNEEADDDGGDVDEEVAPGMGGGVGRMDVQHRCLFSSLRLRNGRFRIRQSSRRTLNRGIA